MDKRLLYILRREEKAVKMAEEALAASKTKTKSKPKKASKLE